MAERIAGGLLLRAYLSWQVGYIMVVLVFLGNTAYEANCFAGAMGALYILYDEVQKTHLFCAILVLK